VTVFPKNEIQTNQAMPTLDADQALRVAMEHKRAGRLQDAEQMLDGLLQAHPKHPEANHARGALALLRNIATADTTANTTEAAHYFKIALEAKPSQGEYWIAYIDALIRSGHTAEARAVLDQGKRAGLQGAPVDALASRLESPSIAPAEPTKDEVAALARLFTAGKYPDAIAGAQAMTGRYPMHGLGWKILATVLKQAGRAADALPHMQKAVELSPGDVEARFNLGAIQQELGQLQEAVATYRRTLELQPTLVEAQFNLGFALQGLGQYAEAAACYRQVLKVQPGNADAHCNLGLVLQALGHYDDALTHYRRALKIKPGHVAAHSNLGSALHDLGQVSDAIASFRRALAYKPGFHEARSNLLFGYNFLPEEQSAVAFAEALQFGKLATVNARPYTAWPNLRSPERRLRIGLVSGDLRSHSVGHFLEGTLKELTAGTGRLEFIAYSNHVVVDAMTLKIKACCAAWRSVVTLSDEALARLIREDAIDILIDLSGHTGSSRLPMFAWKPAPVQAAWLGYYATTGLPAIDYVFADPWAVSEAGEAQFTERVWRLPEVFSCFTAPDVAVDVSPLPALENGYVTFGSFNNLSKMNDAVLDAWARILQAVPDSRLYLKTRQLGVDSVREKIVKRFAGQGIQRERLILEGNSPRAELLAKYRLLDIALDTFPYTGCTTTAEALWMGVPVLSLMGERFLARQSASLLHNAGLADWIATDADDYRARALSHTADLPALAALRSALRQATLASPIFDARRFAGHFEQALRGMWTRWLSEH